MRMLKISLNGIEHDIEPATSVAALLAETGYGQRRIAVEINCEILPKSVHAQRLLQDGDRVEIVQALGGG